MFPGSWLRSVPSKSPWVLTPGFCRAIGKAAEMREDGWAERARVLTPLVLRRIRSGWLSEPDAQDACQDAWLALLSRPGALRDQSGLTAWLCTTARRHAARVVARRVREPLLPPPSPEATPEAQALLAERDRALWRAVDALPERHRRLLYLLAHRPELSVREVAAELGISPASLGTLRRRCCALVRRRLAAEGFGEPWP